MAKKADTFFETFKARWTLAHEAEKEQRDHEIEDLEFEAGAHWDPKVKKDREDAGKPALTIDLLSGPIKQVTNQQRTARPGIDISPVGLNADAKKASYWQGYVRRAERLSGAGRIYSWAGQHQVRMGRGFWVIRNQYIGHGFEQESRLEEIDNQHTIYCDPTAKKLDGSDKKWAIRFEDLTHEDYIARFGESRLAEALGTHGFAGIGDSPPEWITAKHCRIAEYYYLEPTMRTRHLLDDGSEIWAEDLEYERGRENGKFARVPKLDGRTITQTRKIPTNAVHWCLLNGLGEKLDSARIPGEYIPVVMIYGERRNIDGKRDYRGLVRMAKDPSRMEDFCESSLMEAISIAKTAPWLAEWDQISEFAEIWQTSNRVNYAVLPYKRQSGTNGAPIPPPQRVPSGVDVSHLTLAAQRMQNHVRNVAGQQDVFSNETANEQSRLSGRAYNFRRMQQELGTSDYMENLGDGIVLTAKILMSQAREMLDTPRVVTLSGEDAQDTRVVIYNSEFGPDQEAYAQRLAGEQQIQDLFDISGTQDDYDIAVSPGRRHDTAMEESRELLSEVVPKLPPEMQMVAFSTLIRTIDGPGMAELAAKLDPQDDDSKIPPAVKQKLQLMQQQLEEAARIIETDQVKQQAQIAVAHDNNQTKIAIEQMQQDAKIAIEKAKIEAQKALALFEARVAAHSEADSREHESREGARSRGHEWDMAQMTAMQADAQLDHEAAIASEQAEQGHQQTLEQIQATPKPNGAGR